MYSRYFPVPQKYGGLRPILDLRLLNHALIKKVAQNDHFETDPLANMPRGLVHVAGSERRVLSQVTEKHTHPLFTHCLSCEHAS